MKSRRDALRTLAAGAMLPALHGQHQHQEPLVQLAKPQAPKHIGAEDFKLLGELVDTIIPRTDTPGATDAGVPFFIDRALETKPELAETLSAGLAKLRESGFSQASPEERLARLTKLAGRNDPFLQTMKELTIDGYYTSREGLVHELGYHGNTYLKEFKGCTHPEHQGATDAN